MGCLPIVLMLIFSLTIVIRFLGSQFNSVNRLFRVFSIVLTETQLPVLVKIKEFLENNLGFDLYSVNKLNSTSAIAINTIKKEIIVSPLHRSLLKTFVF